MNDREIIARLEAASPTELAGLLRRPSESEARVYRVYFGNKRYEALRGTTLTTRGVKPATKRGNVVILHGILGGELTVRDSGSDKLVWMNIFRLAFGAVDWLRMKNGKSVSNVRPTGILKKWYAEQILGLSREWNVQTYWYDWRLDLNEIADGLHTKIVNWFGDDTAVNLVAHSMGGLVSRTYIARHPKRWNKGGKLIMLGTPNHGSFSIPQMITGAIDTVRKLALLDLTHSLDELTGILGGLPGALQMLPSPLVMPAMAPLYQSSTWGGRVPQALLDRARQHHDTLADVVDGGRMHYIAGCNRRTHDDILDWKRLDSLEGYSASLNGDGTVPHRLGLIERNGSRIPTWFVQEEHGALPNNERVIAATNMLLIQDKCDLSSSAIGARGVAADRMALNAAAAEARKARSDDETRLAAIIDQLHLRTRATESAQGTSVSPAEIEAAEIVLCGFLAETTSPEADSPGEPLTPSPPKTTTTPKKTTSPKIEIALLRADLGELPAAPKNLLPVDAISVGHYHGVAPQNAELALDRVVSGWKPGDPDAKLLITALNLRGSIASQLGQQFVLPDPHHPGRLAVLVGMGNPGKFGIPELTVAVRELVWTLGRMKRRHLATVLIGARSGNLTIPLALQAWLRGIRRALFEVKAMDAVQLERITFIVRSPANFVRLHLALTEAVDRLKAEIEDHKLDPERLEITYVAPDSKLLEAAKVDAEKLEISRVRKSIKRELNGEQQMISGGKEPIRFTVGLSKDTYEFSVLSNEASIPQRNTTVDPRLVEEINNDLVAAPSFIRQQNLGNLLGRMLVPEELRSVIVQPGVPTVLLVDATTARIHFEMAALSPAAGNSKLDAPLDRIAFDETFAATFVGVAASLTRQLRTTFAPLPEPPIMSGLPLRVLVIADPCEEAPLPGAQQEGEAVAQLFEQFKESGANIELVRLFGPSEATRVAVLDHLINQRFDLVHYAGHCFFKANDPPRSGWLFTGNQVLSAYELSRVDRIPRFVFSNACESGITPDRADQRNAGLAPSFAESFFARGVCNFICTAWPVDDAAALAFASRFYSGLLGLGRNAEAIHEAIKAARIEIAALGQGGLSTWGAYQHYGDPNFRIGLQQPKATSGAPKPARTNTRRPRPRPAKKSKAKRK